MVKVERIPRRPPVERKPRPQQRIGFLQGKFDVPDDFDTMFAKEIEEMFYGGSLEPPQKPETS